MYIVGRVRAQNSIGYSDWSQISAATSGAFVKTLPYKMSAPYLGTDITLNQLQVKWDILTGDLTGSDDIDSYQVDYDGGTNKVTWTELAG